MTGTRWSIHRSHQSVGFPHPNYFPFESISARVYAADSFPLVASYVDAAQSHKFNEGSLDPAECAQDASVPKVGGPINLATSLQYTLAMGILPLREFTHEFTKRVFQPAYANYATYCHAGNTDAYVPT